MAYIERDDRELDLTDQSNFYEDDSLYEELYSDDGFGERVDSGRNEDEVLGMESTEVDEAPAGTAEQPATRVEEGFGEAINPTTNPHIDDQLADPELGSEAEAEYTGDTKDESLLDKAKNKIDEWTDNDKSV